MLPLWIFSEGDRERGLGHLSRCSAYATTWRQQGGSVYWRVDGDALAAAMLRGETVSWGSWQQQTFGPHEAVAIVDSYSACAATLASIARQFQRVIYLDDTERLEYPRGLVIHAAPSPPRPHDGPAIWRYGPGWQPLRPAFWSAPRRARARARIQRCLVIMGGCDIRQLLPDLVRWLHEHSPQLAIEIVSPGPIADLAHGTQHHGLGAGQMSDLMCRCDLAIASAGQVSYELARCGVPAVLIGVADNQAEQLAGWCEAGFVHGGWWHDPQLLTRLGQALLELASAANRTERMRRLQAAMMENGTLRALAWLNQP